MAVEILINNEGRLNCHTCDETLKKERGHDTEGIIPYLVDGKRIFRCPLTQITPLSYEYIKAFSFYEKGYLPNGKGWIEESNKYIQAMMILDGKFKESNQQRLAS